MIFPTLYKYTSKGQVQQWQIAVEDDSYITVEGINALTTSSPTRCVGKNIGKSNQTTPQQQAQLEAQAKWQKKLDSGYNEVLTTEKKYFEPMLAHEFKKYEKLLFTVPTFIQPKLDGVRCYMDGKKLMSRSGNEILSCPHLQYNFHGLDGELYNHDLKKDFNKIISLTRQSKPTLQDLEDSKNLIQYWVYDYPYLADKVFSERYEELRQFFVQYAPECDKLVPTYEIKDREHLDRMHAQFMDEGYEGSIIRLDLGAYENKRSKQLLKLKDFVDDEFEIINVNTGVGNRSDCAATLTVKLPNGVLCDPSMTGTAEFMTRVLIDKDQIIGKMATIKYFGYTAVGSLRHPTLKNIIGYD